MRKQQSENQNFIKDPKSNSLNHYDQNKIIVAEDESIVEDEKRVSHLHDLIISPGMLVQGSTNDPFQVYDFIKVLGEGSYGKVSKVIHRKLNIFRALKAIDKKTGGFISEEHQKKLIKEISILKSLDHPNIIKVYEYFDTESRLYIVTELCNGGELFERILKMKNFSEKTVANVMKQLLSAVNYCHLNNVIHRDLKPENILIETQADAKQDYFRIKIIDFGTSDVYRNRRNSKIKKLTEKIGSSYYMAPEVLNGNYNEKCDIWSCGVIMYMLLCGSPPFDGANDQEIFKSIKKTELNFSDNAYSSFSYEAKELLRFLLNRDVNKRFSAQQALDHAWFKTCESEKNEAKDLLDTSKLEKIAGNLRKFQTNQKMQQACIKYIVHNMVKKEEVEEYRRIFTKFDINHDGRLSKEELIEGFSQTMTPAEAKMEVERLINDIDGDKNNYIEFEEFLSAFMDKENLLKEENLSETFMLFDKDCSGKISINEIKNIMGEGLSVNEDVWKGILLSIDSNSDGEISYKEFKDMMRKMIQ